MDLIYTDENREDLGILFDYSFDLAFGSSENDFELKTSTSNHILKQGYYVYIDGTEYGGVVDDIKVKTESKELIYAGRTYHGILESKVIEPGANADYLNVSGEANKLLGQLIERLALTDLFKASTDISDFTISNYQFSRYVKGYTGIKQMLNSVGAKLHITFEDGYVVLSALPIVDYSKDDEFDTEFSAGPDTTYIFNNSILKTKRYNEVNYNECLFNINPKFVNKESDYHLDTLSPAIGIGNPKYSTGLLQYDLDGVDRGNKPDAGAYQYVPIVAEQ